MLHVHVNRYVTWTGLPCMLHAYGCFIKHAEVKCNICTQQFKQGHVCGWKPMWYQATLIIKTYTYILVTVNKVGLNFGESANKSTWQVINCYVWILDWFVQLFNKNSTICQSLVPLIFCHLLCYIKYDSKWIDMCWAPPTLTTSITYKIIVWLAKLYKYLKSFFLETFIYKSTVVVSYDWTV